MHSNSNIENEYIFKCILFIRKALPKSDTFYIFFFLCKYLPLILFSHANYSTDTNLFTLTKILRSLTVFYHNQKFHYGILCVVIYIIILCLIGSFLFLFLYFYFQSKSNDKKLYDMVTNQFEISKSIKIFIYVMVYSHLIVLFFYQHILEILAHDIIEMIYSFCNKSNFVSHYANEPLSTLQYMLSSFNLFFFILLIIIMIYFFYIMINPGLKYHYGIKASFSYKSIIIYSLMWSIQGVYTSSFILAPIKKKHFQIIVCYILVCLFILQDLLGLRRVSFLGKGTIDSFIKYMDNFVLTSGVIEIIVYHFGPSDICSQQSFYFIILLIGLFDSICIKLLMDKCHLHLFVNKFATLLFNYSKNINYQSFFQFYLIVDDITELTQKQYYLYKIILAHKSKCSHPDTCQCRKYIQSFKSIENYSQIEKQVHKFIKYTEIHIIESITNYSKEQTKYISRLLFLHCEYLFTLKRKKIMNLLYLTKYYLINKKRYLSFYDSYFLYEINSILLEDNFTCQEEQINCNIVSQNIVVERIQQLMEKACFNIDKVYQYKNAKNANSMLYFSFEDIFKAISEYYSVNQIIINVISSCTNEIIFDYFIELRFIILFYIRLFNLSITNTALFFDGKDTIPEYEDILTKLSDYELKPFDQSFLILQLNKENKFIVKYISLELAEMLSFPIKTIQGMDFHEFLIPKYISEFHEIYMKNFILYEGREYTKSSYILNSKGQLVDIIFLCKTIPAISSFFNLIILFERNIDPDYNKFTCLANSTFDIFSINRSFENKFYLSPKVINSSKINICEYLGISKDKINDIFKKVHNDFYNKHMNMNNDPLMFPSSTAINKDDVYYYKNIDRSFFKKGYKPEIIFRDFIVEKEKLYKAISKFSQTIELLNQDKLFLFKTGDKNTITTFDKSLTIQSRMDDGNNSDYFILSFQFKSIGNEIYYVLTISELKEGKFLITGRGDATPLSCFNVNAMPSFKVSNNHLESPFFYDSTLNVTKGSPLVSSRKSQELISLTHELDKVSKIRQTISSTDLSVFNLSSTNVSLSRNQSTAMLNSPITGGRVIEPIAKFLNFPSPNMSESKLQRKVTQVTYVKAIIILLLIVIAILNITDFAINKKTTNYALNIFNINAYAIFITNNIYNGALAVLNSCFVKDDIIAGDLDTLKLQVRQNANDIINCFFAFNTYTNKMINEKGANNLYKIFHEEEEYSVLRPNWYTDHHTSNLAEEIYYIYRYMKSFDLSKGKCRIKLSYFNYKFEGINSTDNGILDQYLLSSQDEQFVFYISKNIVSTISRRLEKLMKESTNILDTDNKKAKKTALIIVIVVIILSIIIYGLIVFGLTNLQAIISSLIFYIFIKKDHEDMFYRDLQKFKLLIYGYSLTSFIDYSYFKMGLGDFMSNKSRRDKHRLLKASRKLLTNLNGSTRPIARMLGKTSHKDVRREKETKQSHKKKEELMEKNSNTNSLLMKKSKPRFGLYFFIILSSIFIIYFGFQILNILICLSSFNRLIVENSFGVNVFSRGPKFNEIVLYSIISVLMNDVGYLTREQDEYDDYILSNSFDVKIDLKANSIFQSFGNSKFSYLYYHIYIIRKNIEKFLNDDKYNGYLKQTTYQEIEFAKGDSFCISSSYYYLLGYYNKSIKDFKVFISYLNEIVTICRTLGNGINLNGHNSAYDLILQQLTNMYSVFKQDDCSTKQIEFFKDKDYKIIIDTALSVFRNVQFSDAYSVLEDIEHSYKKNFRDKVFFSVSSIIFSGVIILSLILIMDHHFEKTIYIIKSFVEIMENINKSHKCSIHI